MTRADFVINSEESLKLKHLAEKLLLGSEKTLSLRIEGGDEILIPPFLARLIRHSVDELSNGQAITILPTDEELSTFEAASILGVSRPFLISNLLDSGRIPCRKVGTHRRISITALMEYKADLESKKAILDAMTAEEQVLGLY